jgi:hypothetical protein
MRRFELILNKSKAAHFPMRMKPAKSQQMHAVYPAKQKIY